VCPRHSFSRINLILQIISLQAIHYLTLSTILPPLLGLTNPSLLTYSGGPSTVGHILDWREMASRPTVSQSSFHNLLDFSASNSWRKLRGAWAGGKQIGEVVDESATESTGESAEEQQGSQADVDVDEWDLGIDDFRSWLIAFGWILTSVIE
jgi:hypothetical protein